MLLFFDMEFTGLHKDTTLISIAMVDNNNRMFYGEFTDYDRSQCNEWINENVISNLITKPKNIPFIKTEKLILFDHDATYVVANKASIKEGLLKWLSEYDTLDWISDVCHYDFILLIDLLYGDALNMPDNASPVCHDVNYDIATFYDITEKEAFDKSRKDLLGNDIIDIYNTSKLSQHNALYDAFIIKGIYNKIALY